MNVESKTKDKPKLFPLSFGERGRVRGILNI